jgi:hypothetical protein
MELGLALDALRFGEVHEIVLASPSGLHGYKEGRKIWITRMRAMEWIEFQFHAKLLTKTKALAEVADAFGIDESSIKEWREKAKALFGEAVFQENLKWSKAMGRRHLSIRQQLASGQVEKSLVARDIEYLDMVFGRGRLDTIAGIYKGRKRRTGKGATARLRGETGRS